MTTHFASTIYAVRQMNPHVTVPAVVPGSSSPAPVLPEPAPRPSPRSKKKIPQEQEGTQASRPFYSSPEQSIRPVDRHARRVMVLPDGQSLTILNAKGRPLLEITSGEKGPEVRLVQDDLRIDCSGNLDLTAQQITMQATEDVILQGKKIRLN